MKVSKASGKTISFPQLRGSIAAMQYPAFAELKYDGEFNYLHYRLEDYGHHVVCYTINKYGTMRCDFPLLRLVEKALKANNVNSATFVCEIFWEEGKFGALYDLLSHKKDDLIKLRIFDVIEYQGASTKESTLIERKELMYGIGVGRWAAQCWVAEDKEDVEKCFKASTDVGYEGIVVKGLESKYINGPCSWVKMKRKDRSDYKVETMDSVKERISVRVPLPTYNTTGSFVDVGVKAPNRYKKHIKVGDMVTIEHQGVLASGSLRHPVLIKKKGW